MLDSISRREHESVLDWMARQAKCEYLSDLRNLTTPQRLSLVKAVESVTARESEIRQWNDALIYLFHDSNQPSATAAREVILRQLHKDRQQ